MPANGVKHVLFYVPLKPGNLILAEMEDRSWRILRNDEPMEGCRWEAADMAKAVVEFQRMKAEVTRITNAAESPSNASDGDLN